MPVQPQVESQPLKKPTAKPTSTPSTKRGRKPTGRSRECNIQVKVTEEELTAIKKIAKETHTSISKMLRKALAVPISSVRSSGDKKAVIVLDETVVLLDREGTKRLYQVLADNLFQWEVEERLAASTSSTSKVTKDKTTL